MVVSYAIHKNQINELFDNLSQYYFKTRVAMVRKSQPLMSSWNVEVETLIE